MTSGEGTLSSTGFPTPLLITPSGKAAPRRPDPGIDVTTMFCVNVQYFFMKCFLGMLTKFA